MQLRLSLWLCGLLAIALLLFVPAPAAASIHCYPKGGDRVMWRSLQTLRDNQESAWQIIFYKRLEASETESLNLRLVGFPGSVEFTSQPLTLSTRDGQVWTASPIRNTPLPSTTSEYDLREVIIELRGSPAVELDIPTTNPVKLIVPPFVVQEWKTVAQKDS